MQYASYAFLPPPRPEQTISRDAYRALEGLGYRAQAKKNGQLNEIAISPDKEMICRTREDRPQRWVPPDLAAQPFKTLPGTGWYVICAELLHYKVSGGVKDTNFIFDILVCDGLFLHGWTYENRLKLLGELFLRGGEEHAIGHHVINQQTWLATLHDGPFAEFFDALVAPEDEGIVLKDPKAPLAMCLRANSNSDWQVKSRRATLNYAV